MEMIFITTMLESVLLVVILAIIFTAAQFYRKRDKGQAGRTPGLSEVEARAVILTVEETGVYMNHHPLIKLQMQVLPDRGRNFVVEIREVVSYMDLAEFRTGTTVRVKYNPENVRAATLLK
jgi:hypothetical protein